MSKKDVNKVFKKDLARTLSAAHPQLFPTIVSAEEAMDAIFNGIGNELGKGNQVSLTGFAYFGVAETKEHMGRNPRTKEPILVKASRRVTFTALKALKNRVRI